MSANFEELDWRPTPIGTLSLRRRKELRSGDDIYEIKLGDEFLMSSQFTEGEIALARLGLETLPGSGLDIVVGGLGLGYTANAVLTDARVRSLIVVDALPEVIDWHGEGLLPFGARLSADPRCRLREGDFFRIVGDPSEGLDPEAPGKLFHAILVDIDHSPRSVLSPGNAAFYSPAGLGRLADRLHPGGVFGLWSNDPPDDQFLAALSASFARAKAEIIRFPDQHQNRIVSNTIYTAVKPS